MKITLINPYELGRQPFGLAEPAAWLQREGCQVRCCDLSIQKLEDVVTADTGLVAIYIALLYVGSKEEPLKIFRKAVDNVKPAVEVKSRRVGGSTYQVPMEVRVDRQQALAIRWLIGFATSRHEKTMMQKLAGEFLDAAANRGGTIKKRDDTHRMAEANKAFAHYRW